MGRDWRAGQSEGSRHPRRNSALSTKLRLTWLHLVNMTEFRRRAEKGNSRSIVGCAERFPKQCPSLPEPHYDEVISAITISARSGAQPVLPFGLIDGRHWSVIVTERNGRTRIISAHRSRLNEEELYRDYSSRR